MIPAGLPLDQVGIEEIAAVVVEAGDEIPLVAGQGSPEMAGAVMLDELSDIVGQNLAGGGSARRFAEIEASGLGLYDDRRHGEPQAVLIAEPVPDIGVVVGPQLDLGVLDELFFDPKLAKDVLLDLGRNAMRDAPASVSDRKRVGILFVALE